jgi:transposase
MNPMRSLLRGDREPGMVAPDPEVPARHARRRFTTAYKLILRKADACTRHGDLGALLRREGLYSSHIVTWRRQREHGLTPKTRGRKKTAIDPRVKKLDQENRRLTSRLQRAEAVIAFQKNSRARREPRYLVGLKLAMRLLSRYPGRSGRLLLVTPLRTRKKDSIPAGYIVTALIHPTLGRPLVKALAFGSSIPEIDKGDLAGLQIVRLQTAEENAIAELAEASAKARAEADVLEREISTDAAAIVDRFIAHV